MICVDQVRWPACIALRSDSFHQRTHRRLVGPGVELLEPPGLDRTAAPATATTSGSRRLRRRHLSLGLGLDQAFAKRQHEQRAEGGSKKSNT